MSSPCLRGPAPRAGQFLLPLPRLLIQQGNPAAQFRQLTPPGSPPIPAVRGLHRRRPLVRLQPGPGPGLSSQLHPTSHPRRTQKPPMPHREGRIRHPHSENPGPSLPLGPGETSPPGPAKESAMQTNGANDHQHGVSEKRPAPDIFTTRVDMDI